MVGIIYIALAIPYFYLAHKARQKVNLENLQIDELPEEPFIPKGGAALEVKVEVHSNRVDREVRSVGSKPIIDYLNYLRERVQQHINRSIIPKVEEYVNETSQISTRGFIVAGVLSVVAATVAFLAAFKIL